MPRTLCEGRTVIISFVNQKGGVGKSTLSVHCAVWLFEKGFSVALYDADWQRSSSTWMAAAEPEITTDRIQDPAEVHHVPHQIAALARRHDFVICDGPGGLGEVSRTLIVLSHLALFPITPSYLDVKSVQAAVSSLDYAEAITHHRTPGILLHNKIRKRSALTRDLVEVAPTLGVSYSETGIRDLDAFKDAAQRKTVVMRIGRAGVNAAKDVNTVFSELLESYLEQRRVANG